MTIAIKGTPQQIPAGYQLVDRTAGVNDLLRPEHVAAGAISIVAAMMSTVAAADRRLGDLPLRARAPCATSPSTRPPARRRRDPGRARGTGGRRLAAGRGVSASDPAVAPRPDLPDDGVEIPARCVTWLLPIAAIVIGLLASLAGLRRAVDRRAGARIRGAVTDERLAITDLVVEYSHGGYAVRPIDGSERGRGGRALVILLRVQRLREDDVAVVPRWHSAPDVRKLSPSMT